MEIIIGKHMKKIRKAMGLTQAGFANWLKNMGVVSNRSGKAYGERTIASWETGRRAVPEKVKKTIVENITVQGCPINYEYLYGNSNNMIDKNTFVNKTDISSNGSCNTCKYINMSSEQEPCAHCTKNVTDNYEPMTNGDYIQSLSNTDLSMIVMCPNEIGFNEVECHKHDKFCQKCKLNWLMAEREVEVDENI